MITKIDMKNVATYNSEGATIDNLTNVNYFFGNNGSGKSTIGKYLQFISDKPTLKPSSLDFSNCSQIGYDSATEEILVFNNDFIRDNFNESTSLKGVFSLNQTNTEIDDKIKENETKIIEIKSEKEKLSQENNNLDTKKNDLQNNIHKICFDKRDIFKSFVKIGKLDHASSKKNNYEKINGIINEGLGTKINFPELNESYKKLYEENLIFINSCIDKILIEQLESSKELKQLLNEVIIGKEDVQIAKMINDFGLKSWIANGKSFLEKTKTICPFCQKETIDDDFINQLNSIFDETYQKKIKQIEVYKQNYVRLFNNILQNIQNVTKEYNKGNIVSDLYTNLKDIFDTNVRIIDDKLKNPNERKELKIIDQKTGEKVDNINSSIRANNEIVNSIGEQKEQLIKNIWTYLAYESKTEIDNYNTENNKIDDSVKNNTDKIKELTDATSELEKENTELRKQTVNTEDAVKQINQILQNSGFQGFKIIPKETINNIPQYYISRNESISSNNIFESLSEGEKNFISFLYFYQLCLGTTNLQESLSKKKIIVIDDPVSSMDSQVLFIVSTLINQLIAYKDKSKTGKKVFSNSSISQVFILTHNYYFYKEIAMDKRPICKGQKHYLICKNSYNETQITKREYKECDDYSLMWETVRTAKETLLDENHEQNIMLANLFRRILESYANFIGLGHDAWSTIFVDEDKDSSEHYLKCAFISMINDESHKVSPFDSLYFQKIHNESPSKLFAVFESIFTKIGKEHYYKMMEIKDSGAID